MIWSDWPSKQVLQKRFSFLDLIFVGRLLNEGVNIRVNGMENLL